MHIDVPTTATLASIALGVAGSTLCGGALALVLRRRIHLILGFSAGAVVGVALLELLPEALAAGSRFQTAGATLGFVALGFVIFMLVDRHGGGHAHGPQSPLAALQIGPAALVAHSLLDGLGIGLAFHDSSAVGLVVAIAVMAHDFSDGINTVNLSLVGVDSRGMALRWLTADAVAAPVGILLSQLLHLDDRLIVCAIALFAGSFLYLGAGKLVAESYERHPSPWTGCAVVLGVGFIYGVARLTAL